MILGWPVEKVVSGRLAAVDLGLERYLEFKFRHEAGKAAGSYILAAVAFCRCTRLKELAIVRAQQDDTAVFHDIPFPGVASTILQLRDSCEDPDTLFFQPLTYPIFVELLFKAAASLGCPCRVTHYMGRHGGVAEALHRELQDVYGIQLRARWAQIARAKRFTKPGKLIMLEVGLSP